MARRYILTARAVVVVYLTAGLLSAGCCFWIAFVVICCFVELTAWMKSEIAKQTHTCWFLYAISWLVIIKVSAAPVNFCCCLSFSYYFLLLFVVVSLCVVSGEIFIYIYIFFWFWHKHSRLSIFGGFCFGFDFLLHLLLLGCCCCCCGDIHLGRLIKPVRVISLHASCITGTLHIHLFQSKRNI